MSPSPELRRSRSSLRPGPPSRPVRSMSLIDSWRRRLLGGKPVPLQDTPTVPPVDDPTQAVNPGAAEPTSSESGSETQSATEAALFSSTIEGVVTQGKILRWFFEQRGLDVVPVTTETFMKLSRDQYNAAWLARELIQNFTDENPEHLQTLDDVSIISESLPDGGRRFTIEGNWAWEDNTGALVPDSDKPKGQNSAGGNGIGLKQAAIRMLRDVGATRFELHGEGWDINYRMALADDVNQGMAAMCEEQGGCPAHQIRKDWLVAELRAAPRDGKCRYIIEVNDPEVISALEQMKQIGVSSENEHLQDMDFENEYGAIKWLPLPESGQEQPEGRLFVNGQVMHYQRKGESVDDYWTGPQMVTIRLNNVKYDMSIDRPPVDEYDLSRYSRELVRSMTVDQAVEQLRRSRHIWTTLGDRKYGSRRKGCFVIIEALVDKLRWDRDYHSEDFATLFPDEKLVANDGLNESQVLKLIQAGYTICPSYFAEIGMPTATSKLEQGDRAEGKRPEVSRVDRDREYSASEVGVEVDFDTIPFDEQEQSKFFEQLQAMLGDSLERWEEVEGSEGVIRIHLSKAIDPKLLHHPLHHPRTQEHRLVRALRGFAVAGLENGVFDGERVYSMHDKIITTYATSADSVTEAQALFIRNTKVESTGQSYIEFKLTPEYLAIFRSVFGSAIEEQEVEQEEQSESGSEAGIQLDAEQGAEDHKSNQTEQGGQEGQKKSEPEEPAPGSQAAVKKRMDAIPVTQPESEARREFKRKKKEKEVDPDPQPEVPDELGQQLPGIAGAVDALDAAVPPKAERPQVTEPEREEIPVHDPFRVYLRWRESGDFYGEVGRDSRYLGARNLGQIVNKYGEADIAVLDIERKRKQPDGSTEPLEQQQDRRKSLAEVKGIRDRIEEINKRMELAIRRTQPDNEWVDDFEIIVEPDEEELVQLELLRTFVSIAANVDIPNDMFLYDGTGTKGINLERKAIGLHVGLTKVNFFEAVRTLVHEVAHNLHMDHKVGFVHTMESLFAAIMDRQEAIFRKILASEDLTEEERVLVDIREQWDEIIGQGFSR